MCEVNSSINQSQLKQAQHVCYSKLFLCLMWQIHGKQNMATGVLSSANLYNHNIYHPGDCHPDFHSFSYSGYPFVAPEESRPGDPTCCNDSWIMLLSFYDCLAHRLHPSINDSFYTSLSNLGSWGDLSQSQLALSEGKISMRESSCLKTDRYNIKLNRRAPRSMWP